MRIFGGFILWKYKKAYICQTKQPKKQKNMTSKFTILGLRNFSVKMFNHAVYEIRQNPSITDSQLWSALRNAGFNDQLHRASVVYHDSQLYVTYLNNAIKTKLENK